MREFQAEPPRSAGREPSRAPARSTAWKYSFPSLQEVLGPPAPKIVPLLVSDAEPERVATVLSSCGAAPETLVVISSDLSHFLPYAQARRFDADTAQRILSFRTDLDGESRPVAARRSMVSCVWRRCGVCACSYWTCAASGDTAGGRDEVVGYAAFALCEDIASQTPLRDLSP